MKRTNCTFGVGVAMIMAVLFMFKACANHVSSQTNDDLEEFCATIINMGPDGHYLLNWRAITQENTERVNQCIKALGISNVKVAQNFSDLRHYE